MSHEGGMYVGENALMQGSKQLSIVPSPGSSPISPLGLASTFSCHSHAMTV